MPTTTGTPWWRRRWPKSRRRCMPTKPTPTTDAPWWKGVAASTPHPRFEHNQRTSQFVTARDGTRIAVHLFLPEGLPPDEKIPTIMIITPYFSAMEYRNELAAKVVARLSMTGGLEWAAGFNR